MITRKRTTFCVSPETGTVGETRGPYVATIRVATLATSSVTDAIASVEMTRVTSTDHRVWSGQ